MYMKKQTISLSKLYLEAQAKDSIIEIEKSGIPQAIPDDWELFAENQDPECKHRLYKVPGYDIVMLREYPGDKKKIKPKINLRIARLTKHEI